MCEPMYPAPPVTSTRWSVDVRDEVGETGVPARAPPPPPPSSSSSSSSDSTLSRGGVLAPAPTLSSLLPSAFGGAIVTHPTSPIK